MAKTISHTNTNLCFEEKKLVFSQNVAVMSHITKYLQSLGDTVYHRQVRPLMQVFQSVPRQEERVLPSCPKYRKMLSGQ